MYHLYVVAYTSSDHRGWTAFAYDVLFQLHLIIAMVYHVCPLLQWELFLWRIDRLLVLWTSTLITLVCLHHAHMLSWLSCIACIASLTMSPWITKDTYNLMAHGLVTGASVCEFSRFFMATNERHDFYHTRIVEEIARNFAWTVFAGGFYVLESVPRLTLPLTLFSWHDVFHCIISVVYVHRLNAVHPFVFRTLM
jgi:hypothetical protein